MKPLEARPTHPALNVVSESLDGYAAVYEGKLKMIVSVATEQDGKRWLHASVSRFDRRMPSYSDKLDLKRLCIGDHRTALQVFPPKKKHINLAGDRFGLEVLHLWCCLDGDVTPDFTQGGDTI